MLLGPGALGTPAHRGRQDPVLRPPHLPSTCQSARPLPRFRQEHAIRGTFFACVRFPAHTATSHPCSLRRTKDTCCGLRVWPAQRGSSAVSSGRRAGCRRHGPPGFGLSAGVSQKCLALSCESRVEGKEFVTEAALPGASSPGLQRRPVPGPERPVRPWHWAPPTFFLSFGSGRGCHCSSFSCWLCAVAAAAPMS